MTVCSENIAFGRALTILLQDAFDVGVVSRLGDVDKGSDVLVYQVDRDPPVAALASVAAGTPTLVLGDPRFLIPSVDANCRGFLPQSAPLEDIRHAVISLVDGGAVVPPDLLGTVLRHLVDRRRMTSVSLGLDELTDREREVFWLAARGARKDEIGEALFISPATARTHLQRLYRKLGVHSQAELMALAAESESEKRRDHG